MATLKSRLEQTAATLHQNAYWYYPTKAITILSEALAFLFAMLFIIAVFFVDGQFDKIESPLRHTNGLLTGINSLIPVEADKSPLVNARANIEEALDVVSSIKLFLQVLLGLTASIFLILWQRLRAGRLFRSRVKSAEREINRIIEDHAWQMNELN